MKVGVIGIGKLGRIHARIYKEREEFNLVGICDLQKSHLENLEDVPFFTDYKQMLQLEEIDAVSIATPTTFHYEIAKFFLDNGIACLIEKPIVVNTYSIYTVDIKPKGFSVIEIDGYVTENAVQNTLKLLENDNLRERLVSHNYEIASNYYSYKTLHQELSTLIFKATGCQYNPAYEG